MSLHDALITGNFIKSRYLISQGVDINSPDEDGHTPLLLAVIRPGKEQLTQLLLTAGALVDLRNKVGETALMLALHHPDNQENVRILVHAKADTDLVTQYVYSTCD